MINKNGWNMNKKERDDLAKILEPYGDDAVDRLMSQLIHQYPNSPASELLNILFEIQSNYILPESTKNSLDDTINGYEVMVNYYGE